MLDCFMMHQFIDTMKRPFPQTDQAGNVAIGSIITNIEIFGWKRCISFDTLSLIVFALFRLPLAHADRLSEEFPVPMRMRVEVLVSSPNDW
jgi:hypothetical protein